MNYPYSNNAVMYQRQIRKRQPQAVHTNPIYSRPPLEKIEIAPEFMSSVGAEIYKNQALANMLTKNPLRYGMTISDYGASLMRMGKVPEKDFFVMDNALTEINRNGQRVKETIFYSGKENSPPIIECNYYNSLTQDKYKTIRYTSDGIQTKRFEIT